MSAILGFLLVLSDEARLYVKRLIGIALVFSLMLIVSSFGYVQIRGDVGIWGFIFGFTLILITIVWYIDIFLSRPILARPTLVMVSIALILVSLMGATDKTAVSIPLQSNTLLSLPFEPGFMRYIGALAGILFAEGAAFVLAGLGWFEVLVGFGGVAVFSTGVELKDVPGPAWKTFRALAIISFWLGFTGAAACLATPYVPVGFAWIVWLLVLVIIPGAVAIPSEVPFKIVFYITLATLLVMLAGVIGFVLAGVGVIEPLPMELARLWKMIPVFPSWLKWFVGLGSLYVAAILIAVSAQKPWISLSAGAIVGFIVLALGVIWFIDVGYKKLYLFINGAPFTAPQKLYWIVFAVIAATFFFRNVLYRRLSWIAIGPMIVILVAMLGHLTIWHYGTVTTMFQAGKALW